jgi:Family of unknown function (DUF5681)
MSKASKKCHKDYAVGYGKPPVHNQFRKGQSGNPTGRPPASEVDRARALVMQEAYRKVTVREGDKVTEMPALKAVLRGLVARAVKGSVAAQREILRNIQAIEAETLSARNNKSDPNERLEDLTNEQLDERIKDALKWNDHIQNRLKDMGLD